ncbi:MAG: efflux RND transporter permease subunit [Thermovirgaceae bacterium]|nr:efflux RND transporter permease subunit [Thermovirgaceae bacterium]
MSIIGNSVRRPVLTTVIMSIFVLLGLYSFYQLGVALLPKIDIPVVLVRVPYSGAGPLEVERLIVQPIEDAVASVEGVKEINGYALEGTGFVVAVLNYEVDVTQATLDISTRVKAIAGNLPDDADEPVVDKVDITAQPFMMIVAKSTLPSYQARDIVDDQVAKRLTQITGMASVDIRGGRVREIHLNADPSSLMAHNLSLRRLASLVRESNFNSPSGSIALGGKETSIRIVGEPSTPKELGEIGIPLGEGRVVRLGNVVRVVDGLAEERNRARFDGRDSILLELIARPNANIVRVSKEVMVELDSISPGLGGSIELEVVYDSSKFVEQSVRNVIRDMMIGTLLTALIIFLFLRQFGSTIAVAISMPTSIIATFIPMYFFDYTLNVMSTLGLAISVGVLVNNAILVLENIYRYRELGMDPITAAEEGTREISLAVISTTATNLGVFIPIAFMGGIVGQFFNQFALTVVFSTLFSLWVAFTVTPMAAARLGGDSIHVSPIAKRTTAWWQWLYREVEVFHHVYVEKAVRHPGITIGFFGILFIGTLFLVPKVGFEFFPRVDEGVIRVNLELSSTASIDATDNEIRKVERFLQAQPYVKSISTTVGGGRLSGVNSGTVRVYLVDEGERKSAFAIGSDLRREFAGLPDTNVTVNVASGQGGGGRSRPVQITITGPDLDVLDSISKELLEKIRDVPGLADLDTDWKVGRFELRLTPDHYRLSSMGVTLSEVAEELRGYLIGIKAGVFREKGYEYDILVKLSDRWIESSSRVPGLPMWTPSGFVPVGELTEVTTVPSPTAIYRVDRQRKVSVTADVAGRTVGEVFRDINPRMEEIDLPAGYRFLIEGEMQNIQENFQRMLMAFGMAIILIFLMIAGILESYLFSLVIMLTIPLSVIGVIPTLLLTGTSLSIYGLLGLVMIVGLVVNNAIVVVDYAEVVRKKGHSAAEAVIEACRVRFRPIIMADVTTFVAMMPLALGLGAGGQYRAPLAIVLIGGLFAGGTMAIFLVPPIYKIVWDIKNRFIRRDENA